MVFMESSILASGDIFNQLKISLGFLYEYAPYWLPVFLGMMLWHEWFEFVGAQFRSNIKWVLLEIKLPKEINKTPLAMEVILNSMYQGAGTVVWWERFWKGKVKDYFSLEMASFGGNVKFFMRVPSNYKNLIEAQVYAQYPEVEIYEVPDYTLYVDYVGKKGEWDVIPVEFKLSKPDAYPIKTYVDYGLDKEGAKEEFKTDPLTSVIEYLGSVKKDEQVWIQIMVRSATARYKLPDGSMGTWVDEGKDLIKKLAGRDKKDEDAKFQMMKLTKGEQEIIYAIERNIAKLGFDCGIRAMYIAKKGKIDFGQFKSITGIFRPFTTNNLNGFGLSYHALGWEKPWEDFNLIRLTRRRMKMFKGYRHRAWFNKPRKLTPFVLSSEELATIYHFPGGVSQTPTFGRIPSRKAEPPVNLPI